jgi:hypothetical protein
VPVPLVGRAGQAQRDGGLTSAGAATGSTTFAAWLRERGEEKARERGDEKARERGGANERPSEGRS